jgi:hypothetical protein
MGSARPGTARDQAEGQQHSQLRTRSTQKSPGVFPLRDAPMNAIASDAGGGGDEVVGTRPAICVR